ncbi:hypothetical protein P692DRAFT_201867131 [Suillus brevipes Sb2]|nr:hypothetical protein P692DRAFT_201867131 [Suillus brevipes Sb2]
MQKLQEENRTIKEENKTLHAGKPKRKRCTNAHDKLSVHEETISIYARKYGMMIEMFPSSNLLNKHLPDSPTPFDSTDRYATASTQESAFLDKLYCHFPESLHKVMESSYFSDLVLKSIPDACANEIKILRGVAGDIFNLPSKYFSNTSYDRANVPQIQRLLRVTSSTNLAYKTFPPVLFPELKEDRSLKTVFRNWLLLARILKASLRGITSLHHASSGGGTHTNSMKWSIRQVTPSCIAWAAVLIVTNINHHIFKAARPLALDSAVHEDFTNAIDCTLAVLDMDSSDDGTETVEDVTGPGTPTAAALERHVNALPSESISQPILSTQRQHTTEAPIVDNVATNNSTAADLEDAAAATPQADEVGAAVISSSGEVLQEAADDLSSTRGRSKKSKRGRKATTPVMATDCTTRQAHKQS